MEPEQQSEEEQGYIKGELLYTIFHNETEHFSIAKIKVLATNEDYKEKKLLLRAIFPTFKNKQPIIFMVILRNMLNLDCSIKSVPIRPLFPKLKMV